MDIIGKRTVTRIERTTIRYTRQQVLEALESLDPLALGHVMRIARLSLDKDGATVVYEFESGEPKKLELVPAATPEAAMPR
jgi:hypothetical protein